MDQGDLTMAFQSWPGLIANAVTRHLQKSQATAKGNLNQTRTNQQSTKNNDNNHVPLQEVDNQPPQFVFATIKELGNTFTNQTGKFPTTSSLGHKYVIIL